MAALGRDLFGDQRMSRDRTRSCATCHMEPRGFTDGRRRALSRTPGHRLRNVPTLFGVGFAKRLNWDASVSSLTDQLRGPVESQHEIDGSLDVFAERLLADREMRTRFAAVFAAPPDPQTIAASLAAYQTSLRAPSTRFDAWVAGADNALSERELTGFKVFTGKGACVTCHRTWRFTDDKPHDIGLAGSGASRKAFKTPTLRELTLTAPYMHDGRFATLRGVLEHYRNGVVDRSSLSPNMRPRPRLTAGDVAALEAFLRTLSSQR